MSVYICVFFYSIIQEAIYSPDTYSYLDANMFRHPGYVVFLRVFTSVFRNQYELFVVAFQLLFGLIATHFTIQRFSILFNFNYLTKIIALLILLFPFFEPLYVANNLCSEGLSYPLYVIFITLSFELIYNENQKKLKYLIIAYILLALTRGQFIFTPFLFAIVYFLKHRKESYKDFKFWRLTILFLAPLIVNLADRTYHKLKDGLFVQTPFTYINTAASAYFVSKDSDKSLFKNEDYKTIFIKCFTHLQENNLLHSSIKRKTNTEYYSYFHKNVPPIANLTVQKFGVEYYYYDKHLTIASSEFEADNAAKAATFILIKHNFKKWINIYYANLTHAFKSQILLLFIALIALFSFIKLVKQYNYKYAMLFLFSSLTISNAMLVAFASHSIMRYLFYNYIFIFLILITMIKQFKNVKNS